MSHGKEHKIRDRKGLGIAGNLECVGLGALVGGVVLTITCGVHVDGGYLNIYLTSRSKI